MANALERWLGGNNNMTPFREFSQIQSSFDRLLNEITGIKKMNELQDVGFSPSCEITDEGNSYLLKFDLPGVTKDQVRVEADKDRLMIHAERKEEKKKSRYLHMKSVS